MTTTTIVVLGMHRSGTSCVTQALRASGVYLGNDLMNDVEAQNLEGHWEAWEAVRINDAILEASDAAWDRVPSDLRLVTPEGNAGRMQSFLSELCGQRVSGFKDPRTVLTFPLWKPHLGDYQIVACLRHPYHVASSLGKREGDAWPFERGLELWRAYNTKLLEHLAHERDVTWFDFDAPAEQAAARLDSLFSKLRLKRAVPAESLINPFLRHHEGERDITDPQIALVYDKLRKLAAGQDAASGTSAASQGNHGHQVAASDEGRAIGKALDLAIAQVWTRIGQLREIHKRQDEVVQRQRVTIGATEKRVTDLDERLAGFDNRLSAHDTRAADFDSRLEQGAADFDGRLEQQITRLDGQWTVQQNQRERMAAIEADQAEILKKFHAQLALAQHEQAKMIEDLSTLRNQYKSELDTLMAQVHHCESIIASWRASLPFRVLRKVRGWMRTAAHPAAHGGPLRRPSP